MQMKKWLLLVLLFMVAGCSLFETQERDQQQIPKSYTLAIGYLNEAKWDRATAQLVETVKNKKVEDNYKQAALLLLAHVTNGELYAYKKEANDAAYKTLYEERSQFYKSLVEMDENIPNTLFLGINYNLKVTEDSVESDENATHFKYMTEHITTHWGSIFNESPINAKLLVEQSRNAVQEADMEMASRLDQLIKNMQ